MKRHPSVSVIVPAYNASCYIEETLASILAQTYPNFDVWVVDDGSEDLTVEVVEQICRCDRRVKLLRQANQGVAAARNLGLRSSAGEYVATLDADDIWFPAKLEKQVARLEQAGTRAGVCYVWSLVINENGEVTGWGPRWDLEGEVYRGLLLRNFIGNGSVPLFRRTYLQLAGGYNTALRQSRAQGCEDWEICLRLAEICEFCVVPEYLVAYRLFDQSMSGDHEAMGRSHELMLQEAERRHPEIHARLFRWSRSYFYVYLASKSGHGGDPRGAFIWLLRSLRLDPFLLCLPWADALLLKGCVRWLLTPLLGFGGRQSAAWRRFRQQRETHPILAANWRQASQMTPRSDPKRLWDRVQQRRWAKVTDYRSCSC